MNLEIEEAARLYAKAQLGQQAPAIAAIPLTDDYLQAGSSAGLRSGNEPTIIFDIPNDLEHICENLYEAILEQSICTPRREGGDEGALALSKHKELVKACGSRSDHGGDNGRLWAETDGNKALLSPFALSEASVAIHAWFLVESITANSSEEYIWMARIKLRIEQI